MLFFIVIIFSFLCSSFYLPSLSRKKSSVISVSNCVPSLLFFCNLGVKLSFTFTVICKSIEIKKKSISTFFKDQDTSGNFLAISLKVLLRRFIEDAQVLH